MPDIGDGPICCRSCPESACTLSRLPPTNGDVDSRIGTDEGLVNEYAYAVCSLASVIATSIGTKRVWPDAVEYICSLGRECPGPAVEASVLRKLGFEVRSCGMQRAGNSDAEYEEQFEGFLREAPTLETKDQSPCRPGICRCGLSA